MAAVYLSARYSRRSLMAEYAKELRALGHAVTSRWIFRKQPPDSDLTPRQSRRIALEDLYDLSISDAIIFFTESTPGKGGRHVELGFAYGLRTAGRKLTTIVIGPMTQTIFEGLGARHFQSWEQARDYLVTNGDSENNGRQN